MSLTLADRRRNLILAEVSNERASQLNKWGEQQHHPVKWSAILSEETGEVAAAALEGDRAAYLKELIQVAAVAVAAIEAAWLEDKRDV